MSSYDPKEVSVLLKLFNDPSNKRAVQEAIDAVRSAEQKKNQELEKAAKEREKIAERGFKKEAEWTRKAEEEEEKRAERAKRREEQLAKYRSDVRVRSMDLARRAQERAAKDQEREESRQRALAERAQRDAERSAARSEAQQSAAAKRHLKHYTQIARGIEDLGRSMVLFGVVSEDSLEKAIRKLAIFEGAVSGLKGLSHIIGPEKTMALAGGAFNLAKAAAPILLPVAGGLAALSAINTARDYAINRSNRRTYEALYQRDKETGETRQDLADASEVESVRGAAERNRISQRLDIRNLQLERGPRGYTGAEAIWRVANQSNLQRGIATAANGETYNTQLRDVAGQRAEGVANVNVLKERLNRSLDLTKSIEAQFAAASKERAEAQKAANVGDEVVVKQNTPLFNKYLRDYYATTRGSITGSSEPAMLLGKIAGNWITNKTRGSYSVDELRRKYEKETSLESQTVLDPRSASRFADLTSASEKERMLAEELTKQKQKQVDLAREIAKTDLESMKQQLSGLQAITAARSGALRSNEARFAMLGTGEQQRLARNFQSFEAGKSLGEGRYGLQRVEELVNAGALQSNDPRVVALRRQVAGPAGDIFFGKERTAIEEAEKQGRSLGEQIADSVVKGSRSGIDPEGLADKLSESLGNAMERLLTAFEKNIEIRLAEIARRQAEEAKRRALEEAGKRAGAA